MFLCRQRWEVRYRAFSHVLSLFKVGTLVLLDFDLIVEWIFNMIGSSIGYYLDISISIGAVLPIGEADSAREYHFLWLVGKPRVQGLPASSCTWTRFDPIVWC